MIGKYEIVAQPILHSAHMLRYTVFVGTTRIGALASFPEESDCRFLENPPPVPPLKIYNVTGRPGRPKKGSRPPVPVDKGPAPGISREDLPPGLSLPPASSDER